MALVDLTKTSGVSLASESHEELLNTIDTLRKQGVGREIDLPQLIVCGDQSSGKSSVLEALSGLKFPTKDNLCTRFATEVILRRGEESPVTVSIIAHEKKSKDEKKLIRDFKRTDVKIENFAQIVQDSMKPMGIGNDASSKRFSKDILRVELSGPTQPNLTLVDLPGLFHSASKDQSYDDAEAVQQLVLSYMKKSRSIILAIISAKSDINNQVVTRYARDVDPNRSRTLGIITKPDTLHAGSEMEKAFFELAENKNICFELGWHVLKNRDYDCRDSTTEQRDKAEKEFFKARVWKSMPSKHVGIDALKAKLSDVLKDQIVSELPGLIKDVGDAIQDYRSRLQRLGGSRESTSAQRMHLLRVSQSFMQLTKAAVDGQYDDTFFGIGRSGDGYRKRLRAVVQNTLTELAQEIQENGQTYKIIDRYPTRIVGTQVEQYQEEGTIIRDEYIDKVAELLCHTRGRELPGTFNPQIIGELFTEQSQKWSSIVYQFVDAILDAARDTLAAVLDHTADRTTCDGILHYIVRPALVEIEREVREEAVGILKPYQQGHPITYNHYLTDNIQKAREAAFKRNLTSKLREFIKISGHSTDQNGNVIFTKGFNETALINALCQSPETDMNRHACNEAVDCMDAYYKVAMKTLVDSFSTLTIENALMKKLSNLVSPEVVIGLSDETVKDIAAESETSKIDRENWNGALKVLEDTLKSLHRLERHKPRERRKRTHREIDAPLPSKVISTMKIGTPLKQEPAVTTPKRQSLKLKLRRVGAKIVEKSHTVPPPNTSSFPKLTMPEARTPVRSSSLFSIDPRSSRKSFFG